MISLLYPVFSQVRADDDEYKTTDAKWKMNKKIDVFDTENKV